VVSGEEVHFPKLLVVATSFVTSKERRLLAAALQGAREALSLAIPRILSLS